VNNKQIDYLKIGKIILIFLISILCILPFYVLIVLSLNNPSTLFYEGNMFVPDFYFKNYIRLLSTQKNT